MSWKYLLKKRLNEKKEMRTFDIDSIYGWNQSVSLYKVFLGERKEIAYVRVWSFLNNS